MNYYIQGNAAKADKIKAAFERLGYNVKGWAFTSGMYYTLNGKIVNTSFGSNEYELVLNNPDYKELELPVEPKFKVGDWVVREDGETFYGGNYAEQITLIEVDEKGKCMWLSSTSWVNDDAIRLWTIQDAKDGDVLSLNGKPFIYSSHKYGKNYCYIDEWGQLRVNFSLVFEGNYVCPATKQERDLLFSKMREVGYEWDADKKELHKIKPHYDIANFYAGMPVLVRDYNYSRWSYVQFSHYVGEECGFKFNACGIPYIQCIPYNDDTKHLLGTTDMPSEEYINW